MPPETGVCATDPARLASAFAELLADRARARQLGQAARRYALTHFGLPRFLERWDEVLAEARTEHTRRTGGATATAQRR